MLVDFPQKTIERSLRLLTNSEDDQLGGVGVHVWRILCCPPVLGNNIYFCFFVMESDYVANLKDCPHYPFFSYNETFALDVFKVTIAGLHLALLVE